LTVGMNSPIFICASSPTSLDASADHRDALLDRPARRQPKKNLALT
jgi:hypothetical protein